MQVFLSSPEVESPYRGRLFRDRYLPQVHAFPAISGLM
jgi:FMN phosphatase YigB (HAD superfamily)